jgi:flap endonuclease-1
MGVKNLMSILKDFAPTSITTRLLNTFTGQTWAIDASIFCYKFMYNPKAKKPNNHINGFYCLFNMLYKNGIRCIMIFDGKSPDLKMSTIKDRKQIRNDLKERVSLLKSDGKIEEANNLEKRIISFPENIYDDIYNLCQLMDVPIYRAEYEADYLCSKLYKEGKVQGVVSNDTDMLMYNVGSLIRNLDYTDEVEHIDLNLALSIMDIKYPQFVQLCMMCGTDFNKGISGYGKSTSYQYIKNNKFSNNIFNNLDVDVELYEGIFNHIMNIHQYDNTDNILVDLLSNKLPNINWNVLCDILPLKCNYRQNTITKHRDNFIFPNNFNTETTSTMIKLSIPKIIKINSNDDSTNNLVSSSSKLKFIFKK